MLRFAGVWISRKHALILTLDSGGNVISSQDIPFESKRSTRNSERTVSRKIDLEDRRNWLPPVNPKERYFMQVLSAILHADRIAIFGPDGTKFDLDIQIRKRRSIFEKVVGVSAARETDREEFADTLRRFYSLRHPAGGTTTPIPPREEDTMAAGA